MNFHIIGKTPSQSDSSPAHGTSVAVAQWVELIRGERVVHQPANPFRTIQVTEAEMYCLECCGLRWHDVLEGTTTKLIHGEVAVHDYFTAFRCRGCGKECP